MGCNGSKQEIVIEITYCGGCGWSVPVRKVCEAIRVKLPHSLIDCKPLEEFTGVLEVHLLSEGVNGEKERRFVYKGTKDAVSADVENIGQKVEEIYAKL
jgi:hypothetical protein